MKKCHNISALALGILATLVSVVGMTGCASSSSALPPPLTFQLLPPKATTIDQLYTDYTTDLVAADTLYKGKRLVLYRVDVEEVHQILQPDRHGDLLQFKDYFSSGQIRFYPNDAAKMQMVEVGYVINIVGNCRGLLDGFIIVDDCYLQSVVGELGGGIPPAFY